MRVFPVFAGLDRQQLYVLHLKQFSRSFKDLLFSNAFIVLMILWKTSKSSLNLSFICEAKYWKKILRDSGMHPTTKFYGCVCVLEGEELTRWGTSNGMISFNWICWIMECFKSTESIIKFFSFHTKINRVLLTKLVNPFKTAAIPLNHFENQFSLKSINMWKVVYIMDVFWFYILIKLLQVFFPFICSLLKIETPDTYLQTQLDNPFKIMKIKLFLYIYYLLNFYLYTQELSLLLKIWGQNC